MEVVPALLGLARSLQKSAACRKDAFRQLVDSKGGVVTVTCQPHPLSEKCESTGQELDLDAENITMLLKTVGQGWWTYLYLSLTLSLSLSLSCYLFSIIIY